MLILFSTNLCCPRMRQILELACPQVVPAYPIKSRIHELAKLEKSSYQGDFKGMCFDATDVLNTMELLLMMYLSSSGKQTISSSTIITFNDLFRLQTFCKFSLDSWQIVKNGFLDMQMGI